MTQFFDLTFWRDTILKSPVGAVLLLSIVANISLAIAWQKSEGDSDEQLAKCNHERVDCEARLGARIAHVDSMRLEDTKRLYDQILQVQKQTWRLEETKKN